MQWKIPLMKVYVSDADDIGKRLADTLRSGYIAEGDVTKQFSDQLKKYFKFPNVLLTNSCTSSLTVALYAAGVGPGDKVITSPHTCMASAVPIKTLGGTVIWGDLDPKTGLLDPDDVRKKIQKYNAKAVICVHWGGDVCDVVSLRNICEEYGVTLIEDAAQALGAHTKEGTLVGCNTADYTCFSFQAVKHLTTGDGGMVVSGSQACYERVKPLTWFGIDRDKFRREDTGEIDWSIDVKTAGFKMHMNDLASTLGLSQLPFVTNVVLLKHKLTGKKLEKELSDIPGLEVPKRGSPFSAYWFFHVLTRGPQDRVDLIQFLREKGIQASSAHMRIDKYSCFNDSPKDTLPGADEFSKRQLCLPCGWWLDDNDIDYLKKALNAFYKSNKHE